ncbi:hypothetical protein Tco_0769455 [Tanacetum coccineum]|uniref:Uncharacterized protein n=1 Tax=Tanacetum coccineum TaxID=301880 RepID=A0ABQ4Z9G0_9ASTR
MCNTDPRSNITKRISQPLRNVMRLFIMVDVDGKMGEQSGQFSPELIPLAIRDMFLPLFCIDVVDEATAKMKLEITSKPIASDRSSSFATTDGGIWRAYALRQGTLPLGYVGYKEGGQLTEVVRRRQCFDKTAYLLVAE